MAITWSMKEKQGEKWQPVALAELAGRTLRQLLEWMQGREVVAEFVITGQNFYFCGTDHWKKRMNKKGKAVLAGEAIDLLAAAKPELLEETCTGPAAAVLAEVESVNPRSQLEIVTLNGGQP